MTPSTMFRNTQLLKEAKCLESYSLNYSFISASVEKRFWQNFQTILAELKLILEECGPLSIGAGAKAEGEGAGQQPLHKDPSNWLGQGNNFSDDKENGSELLSLKYDDVPLNSNPLVDSSEDTCSVDYVKYGKSSEAFLQVKAEDTRNAGDAGNVKEKLLNLEIVRLPDGYYKCPSCEKVFFSKSRVTRHYRTHTGVKPFVCEQCTKSFSSKQLLDSHLVREHRQNTDSALACPTCGKLFALKSSLDTHQVIHQKVKPFSCQICGKSFTQKVSRDSHLALHTGIYPFECEECDKKFPTQAKLNAHTYIHQEPRFSCDVCEKRFFRRDVCEQHRKIHSGNKSFHCSVCTKAFFTKSNMLLHMQVHTEGQHFECGECRAQFRQKSSLTLHQRKHSMNGMHSCLICSKKFPKKYEVERHMRTHSTEAAFLCDTCGKGFKSERSLKEHAQQHEAAKVDCFSLQQIPKPHKCHICTKSFQKKSKLTEHMRQHCEEPRHVCPVCGRKFHRKDVLRNHQFLHTGQKPFTCEQCGKSFAAKTNYRVHLFSHDSMHKWQCDQCDKKFVHKSSFENHKKVHRGAFNYKCNMCTKKFVRKSHYESHVRTHSTERPFQCNSCGKQFKEKKHWREHLKKAHPPEFTVQTLLGSMVPSKVDVGILGPDQQASSAVVLDEVPVQTLDSNILTLRIQDPSLSDLTETASLPLMSTSEGSTHAIIPQPQQSVLGQSDSFHIFPTVSLSSALSGSILQEIEVPSSQSFMLPELQVQSLPVADGALAIHVPTSLSVQVLPNSLQSTSSLEPSTLQHI